MTFHKRAFLIELVAAERYSFNFQFERSQFIGFSVTCYEPWSFSAFSKTRFENGLDGLKPVWIGLGRKIV